MCATGFRMARGKAAALIESGRVQLNWRECMKPDRQVSAGDTVSARGFGKFELTEIGGLTKKRPHPHYRQMLSISGTPRNGVNMEQKQIERINELAKKAKSPEGLTEWEEMERAALRREYIDSVLGSLKGQLDIPIS